MICDCICWVSVLHHLYDLLQPKSGCHGMPEWLTALKRAQGHGPWVHCTRTLCATSCAKNAATVTRILPWLLQALWERHIHRALARSGLYSELTQV